MARSFKLVGDEEARTLLTHGFSPVEEGEREVGDRLPRKMYSKRLRRLRRERRERDAIASLYENAQEEGDDTPEID